MGIQIITGSGKSCHLEADDSTRLIQCWQIGHLCRIFSTINRLNVLQSGCYFICFFVWKIFWREGGEVKGKDDLEVRSFIVKASKDQLEFEKSPDQQWIHNWPIPTINSRKIRFFYTNYSIPVNEPNYKIPTLGDHDIFIALPGAGDELAGWSGGIFPCKSTYV